MEVGTDGEFLKSYGKFAMGVSPQREHEDSSGSVGALRYQGISYRGLKLCRMQAMTLNIGPHQLIYEVVPFTDRLRLNRRSRTGGAGRKWWTMNQQPDGRQTGVLLP